MARDCNKHIRAISTTALHALAAAMLVTVALAGCVTSASPNSADDSASATPSASATASPTPATPPTPPTVSADAAMAALEAQYDARLGVFAVDTGTGTELAWRADDRFAYASTHKVLSAAALLDELGAAGLEETVRIERGDLVTYSPVTELRVGTEMTLGELAAAAVETSDNTAGNLVMERIGGPAGFGTQLQALGDTVTNVVRTEPGLTEATPGDVRDTTSPRAFANNLRAYVLGDAPVADGTAPATGSAGEVLSESERQTLISWMSRSTTGNELIRAGVPSDWTVVDKSGAASYGTRNDIAVLWPPTGAPIVMAVMSSHDAAGSNADYNNTLIADAAAAAIAALR